MNISHFASRLAEINLDNPKTAERFARLVLSDYLKSFGFSRYAFTYYSGHIKTGRKLQYQCVSDALRPWHLHYLEQSYADVDRTLEDVHTMTLPLFWDVQKQLLVAKNNREKRIRLESIEFGVDKGLSIPVHGPNHDFASLTLHQFRGETCLMDYETKQFEWLSAAQIFYHYIKKMTHISEVQQANYQLTRREKQCLMLTAKSWRVEKIAKELNISPRTVNFHIQNANKKLGSNNKYQALYKYLELFTDE